MSSENRDKSNASGLDQNNLPPAENTAGAVPSAPIPAEVVREEVRRRLPEVTHAIGLQVAMGGPPTAFIDKLQPDHIDKVLDYTRDEKTQDHQRILIMFIVGVIAFLALCGMFLYWGKDALLEKIVALFIGFTGGFGVGKWTEKK